MFARLRSHRVWLHLQLPAALLIALLQRTPVVRMLVTAEEMAVNSPAGAILKSAVAAAASLGAVHSLAGATVLQSTVPSLSAKVGTAPTPVGFTVTNTINIMSWKIGGTIPPGMRIFANEDATKTLTGAGSLDATGGGADDGYGGTIGGISSTTPILSGTPTTAGTYTITLQAFEFAALGGLASNTFNFSVTVAADTTPPPVTNVAPSITTQPTAQSVATGASVTLTAAASGTPPPTFQWNKNGTAIAGATSATLVLSNVSVADAAVYTVTVTNSAGTSTSAAASVTVSGPVTQGTAPAIVQSPSAQTVIVGATVAFNVTASGTPAPTYQWRKDSVALAGQTKASLILTGVTAANAGSYTVVATNSAGSVTSSAAALTLSTSPDFGHLTNLAIFSTLTAEVPDFTVATVVGGGSGGVKPLLVRAVGPTLGAAPPAGLGIPGSAVDTNLELFDSASKLINSNDNWGGSATLAAAFVPVGAFPYASANSKDSALLLSQTQPGSYSIKISGVGGALGFVLAEIYDVTPAGTFTKDTHRLLDVSVLKKIAVDESLTVGFNIGGGTSRTVLIRAVGPTLTTGLGIPGSMADPKLELYSGQTVLASNDDWGGDPQINTTFGVLGAFAFGVPTSKDAVIMATLPPGSYTAVVTGGNKSSGYTVVEVYDVP